jgi:hypothetical protein
VHCVSRGCRPAPQAMGCEGEVPWGVRAGSHGWLLAWSTDAAMASHVSMMPRALPFCATSPREACTDLPSMYSSLNRVYMWICFESIVSLSLTGGHSGESTPTDNQMRACVHSLVLRSLLLRSRMQQRGHSKCSTVMPQSRAPQGMPQSVAHDWVRDVNAPPRKPATRAEILRHDKSSQVRSRAHGKPAAS